MIENVQIETLIVRFLSGKASEVECAALEKWVKESPENQLYFQQASNIWQTANPAFKPDQISVEKAEEKILLQIGKRRNSTTGIWNYWQRIAAILIIPLFLLSGYLMIKDSVSYEQNVYQEITVPYGMVSNVNLPDGSNVWLNGGSTLKYPVRFKKGKRQVTMSGEGYFEVESDPENAFIVETAFTTITATGTAFNVNAHIEDSTTAITLAKGIIDIQPVNSKPFRIQPGNYVNVNNKTHQYTVLQTDPYKWYAWKDGLMIFRDDPLAYVFKRLEQAFNIDIIIKEPGIADALYHATFEEESLNEILRLLEQTAPIHFVYLDRKKSADNKREKQQIEVRKK